MKTAFIALALRAGAVVEVRGLLPLRLCNQAVLRVEKAALTAIEKLNLARMSVYQRHPSLGLNRVSALRLATV
ncbi:MAG: hypothetical protein V4805_03045 [Pseudomonadota bacterium]